MEGIEQPIQEKITSFGEKETSKYLGILEADTIRWKKKFLKSITGKRENYSKTYYIAEISSKG